MLTTPTTPDTLTMAARVAAVGVDDPAALYLAGLAASSRRTIVAELRRIVQFFGGAQLAGFPWEALQPVHVVGLRAHLAQTRAPAGANLTLAALRGVLRAAVRLRRMSEDRRRELVDVPAVRGSRVVAGREVDGGELGAVFAMLAARGDLPAARDAAAVALLYGGGLRRQEAIGLRLVDVTPLGLRVMGKGNKQRIVPLPAAARRAVEAWIALRGVQPGPLLCPIDRAGTEVAIRPCGASTLYTAIRRMAKRAKLAGFSCHDLRRTYVGDLLDRGVDLVTVQRLAGHENPEQTSKYDRRPLRKLAKAVEVLDVPFPAAVG